LTIISIDSPEKHEAFLASERRHILMITNHGIHQWHIIPGLPDTGGQNVFVNRFTASLANQDFKITIVNRGGYSHPNTGEWREGLRYKDEYQRIIYIQDSVNQFVRKEDMAEQIPELVAYLKNFLDDEGTPVDLIISHYWDAAKLGIEYNQTRQEPVKHIWVPHSLGAIKKRNMPEETWEELRIDERIEIERGLIKELDGIAATSATIRQALLDDYHYEQDPLFLPPSIDVARYYPHEVSDDHRIWDFLCEHSGLSPKEIQNRKIVTEISRTDITKRKDVLIKAFAKAHQQVPDSFLIISIDNNEEELAQELKGLIAEQDLDDHIAVVGYVWDILPDIYAVTDIYCTPSVMEGFGMTPQEAAATKAAVVASDKVPFVTEYLLGDEVKEVKYAEDGRHNHSLQQGRGAIVVPADEVDGFAHALTMLLSDSKLCRELGENAYHITIPYFSWQNMVNNFLEEIGI
jgi:glycosyltransferase involved in cell wall biosynthesis